MDMTAMLVQLLPASVLPYLKFVVTVLGGAASSVLATYPHVDHRLAIASSVLTAVGTYLTPNVQPVAHAGTVAKAESEDDWITYADCPCSADDPQAVAAAAGADMSQFHGNAEKPAENKPVETPPEAPVNEPQPEAPTPPVTPVNEPAPTQVNTPPPAPHEIGV